MIFLKKESFPVAILDNNSALSTGILASLVLSLQIPVLA